ncbi:sulfite oxidase [Nocardiopsis ansamitocini]|uniref:Sulfite oxidase n=1 Tax=Nocardiopsis ansamitocini TaxID=1670832 RepID=A0A9W6P8S5_9ACTN|nr:sulfite oxidase [Nocardiopsis ansamitocini]GLU49087.1 sulfite oxidase [Nocardiopsis ansamitocini]
MVVHERDPYNAEPPRSALAGGPLTPADTFYSRNHGPVPEIDAASWRLALDGLVQRPLLLSLAELRERFQEHTVAATLQCAGNQRSGFTEIRDIPGEDPWGPCATSTARWTGVRLLDLLTAAGLKAGAEHIAFAAPDVSQLADPPQPYGASVPVAKAVHGEVLLAWTMNGAPLPRVHGAPLRVVVPGWIGARSVKWLQRITAQRKPSGNYFQATAYRLLPADADPAAVGAHEGISLGPVALNCAILRPDGTVRRIAGPAEIVGYAFAGDDRTVARVDVSVNGGRTWSQAGVDAPIGPWTWQYWRTTLDLPEGEVEITARAWDSTGAAQPESAAHLWNPKGYANNSWARLRLNCSR